MQLITRMAAAMVLTLSAIVATGCASPSDKIAEKSAEKLIEKSSGGKANVDLSKRNLEIKTDDGSLSMSADGKLPKDWPSFLVLPKGAKIIAVTDTNGSDGRIVVVSFTVKQTPAEVVDHVGGLVDGWKQSGSVQSSGEMGATSNSVWEQAGEGSDRVSVTSMMDEDGTTAQLAWMPRS